MGRLYRRNHSSSAMPTVQPFQPRGASHLGAYIFHFYLDRPPRQIARSHQNQLMDFRLQNRRRV